MNRSHRTHLRRLLAAAVLLPLLSGCAALALPGPPPSDPCAPHGAPAGASAAAVQYEQAVQAVQPQRMALSAKIAGQDHKLSLDDISTEVAIDEQFLADVQQIDFPARSAREADAFERALVEYIDFMRTAAAQQGYYTQHRDIADGMNGNRSAASDNLRYTLDLPPNRCVLNRP